MKNSEVCKKKKKKKYGYSRRIAGWHFGFCWLSKETWRWTETKNTPSFCYVYFLIVMFIETSGSLHPLLPQTKRIHTPRTADHRHIEQDWRIQTELVSTLAKNVTKPNPFEIIPLQTAGKESNWKTEETLERAAVTLETERIKGSNPWWLWWWRFLCLCILIVMLVLFCIFCFHRSNWHSSATLTEVYPCFFLTCKANARV